MTDPIDCDLLVVGAGLAGMTAACRAVSLGLETVVAGASSILSFASGLMDYLGVYPPGKVLGSPDQGLAGLVSDLPGHAYAKTGPETVRKGFEFLAAILRAQGLDYVLPEARNIPVLTSMGTIRPSFMVPAAFTVGGQGVPEQMARETRPLVVAGIRGLQGFSPSQVANGLLPAPVLPVMAELPRARGAVPPQVAAQLLEGPEALGAWLSQVRPHARGAWACGVPAVFGLKGNGRILDHLARELGCPVFEIPGAPPSVPGLRLKQAFEAHLRKAKVRVLSNTRMADPVFDGERFTLTALVEPEGIRVRARGVILATGRFFGNGLHARRERIVETLFHLDVAQPLSRSLWHQPLFLASQGHGINRAGIETDLRFRPLDKRGRPVFRRLYAVGGILAHNDWARLKSGAGVSIASAITAVDDFFREVGRG